MKFQLYAVVESSDFNVTEIRKDIIEQLNKQSEIETILSVFVDGRGSAPAVYDSDNKLLIEASIKFTTKTAIIFGNPSMRNKIFKKCKLRETKPFRNGRITREDFLKFINETGWQFLY